MATQNYNSGHSGNAMGHGVVDAAGERVKGYVDRGVEYVDRGVDKAREMGGRARKMEHKAEEYLKEHSLMAIGIAVGVGVIAGLLFRGRRGS